MDKYIGTKLVEAEPCTDLKFRLEKGEKINDLTKEPSRGGYKVKYPDSYESWSPKDVFEEAYRHIDNMNFGLAVEAVKKGFKVARKGWNGKNMFAVYQKGYPQGINCNKQTAEAWGIKEGDLFKCEPYLQIKMVNGSHSMWVPSINDVLAEDWCIVA